MSSSALSDLSDDARAVFAAAVRGAHPRTLLARRWAAVRSALPTVDGPLVVVGAGKAALAMATAVDAMRQADGAAPVRGTVVVPHGYLAAGPDDVARPAHVTVVEAGHPQADDASVAAAHAARALAAACAPGDALLVLLSGGASALWGAPAAGVSADELRDAVRRLQHAGADIADVNAVRRTLTSLGGGRLAAATAASVTTVVLSDVVGDDPAVIGSGPTSASGAGPGEAERVLRRHRLWEAVAPSVRARIRTATVPVARSGRTLLLGGIGDALAAARGSAERMGYATTVRSAALTGEAREAGRALAAAIVATSHVATRPTCLLWGGETTVTRRGGGRGGRNQVVALSAAIALDAARRDGRLARDRDVLLLSGGTDGIDGPTDAAGGWATPRSVDAMRARGLDPIRALDEDDAYPALDAAGALLRVGPTHTNVMDVQVALVRPTPG